MELELQKEEGERLQEEVARLTQATAHDQELIRLYFTTVTQSLSASDIRISSPRPTFISHSSRQPNTHSNSLHLFV